MKRLIVVLALALTGVGCTTYSPYGHVGYGRVYESYGYGYPGYVAYPVYGYGYRYPAHRYIGHRDDDHWRGDRDHWRDHREIHRDRDWRRDEHGGHDRFHGDWRAHRGPSSGEHRWHSDRDEHAGARMYRHGAEPGRPDFRHGMTAPGGYRHDARQR